MKREDLVQKTDISAYLNSLSIHEVKNLARAVGIARPATFKKGRIDRKDDRRNYGGKNQSRRRF